MEGSEREEKAEPRTTQEEIVHNCQEVRTPILRGEIGLDCRRKNRVHAADWTTNRRVLDRRRLDGKRARAVPAFFRSLGASNHADWKNERAVRKNVGGEISGVSGDFHARETAIDMSRARPTVPGSSSGV